MDLKQAWEDYRQRSVAAETPAVQVRCEELAFYAGMCWLLIVISKALSADRGLAGLERLLDSLIIQTQMQPFKPREPGRN